MVVLLFLLKHTLKTGQEGHGNWGEFLSQRPFGFHGRNTHNFFSIEIHEFYVKKVSKMLPYRPLSTTVPFGCFLHK